MAIELTRPEAERTPETGVFFWNRNSRPGFAQTPDFYSLGELGLQIRDHASVIANHNVDSQIKPALTESLEELVSELTEIMRSPGPGELLVAAPESLRAYSRLDKLLPDYEQHDNNSPDDTHMHILAIPTDKITAAVALPGLSVSNQYDPVLSLRVQTLADEPLTTYDVTQSDHVSHEVSPGNWYSLPISHVEIRLKPE